MPKYNLERHYNRESALNAQTASIESYLCHHCLFVFNAAFEDMDYVIDYESSRSFSKYFEDYLYALCKKLGETFPLENKTVVEIGCADGKFLKKLREKYMFTGYGYDPSIDTTITQNSPSDDLRFIRGYYHGRGSITPTPDVLILRHILEHQKNPHVFLKDILPQLNIRIHTYIETPAWEWIVENNWIPAFSYEHCSYYSYFSLTKVMDTHKYNCTKIKYGFADEYLEYYGTRYDNFSSRHHSQCNKKHPPSIQSLIKKSIAFGERMPHSIESIKTYIKKIASKSVLWGASGKGTTLLNILDISYKELEYIVDSNPRRHNTFIPHTGQRVMSPENLKQLQPSYILLTNSNYRAEIAAQVAALGLHPTLVPIDNMIKKTVNL